MNFKKHFNRFIEAIGRSKRTFNFILIFFGIYFGLVIIAVTLFQLSTGKIESLVRYGIPGLIYILTLPIFILLLLFLNTHLIKKEIIIKRWILLPLNIAIILLLIISGVVLHYYRFSSRVLIVSEAYIYSAEIIDSNFRQVYYGKPDCLDPNYLEKFSGELPTNPFAKTSLVTFQIPKRLCHGDYLVQLIFGRNTYRDTLNKSLYIHSQKDTIWVYSRNLYLLE